MAECVKVNTALRAVWTTEGACRPPRIESEFAGDTAAAWRAQGFPEGRAPEDVFGVPRREEVPIEWGRVPEERALLESEEALSAFRRVYNPESTGRFPADWAARLVRWQNRDSLLIIEPWNEGLFQVLGISDGASLNRALTALCESPRLAEAAMEHYADHIVALADKVLAEAEVDMAFLYEPIASNRALVVSPETYRRFALPALRRAAACLDRHGVTVRVMWTAGAVHDLIPLCLDAGICGLYANQAGQAGLSYRALRKEFGEELRLFGGIDWRAVMAGPEATDAFLDRETRPLLESGRYVPSLDDTVRAYIPYPHFRYYRERLDRIINEA